MTNTVWQRCPNKILRKGKVGEQANWSFHKVITTTAGNDNEPPNYEDATTTPAMAMARCTAQHLMIGRCSNDNDRWQGEWQKDGVRVGVGCLEPHMSEYDVIVFLCIVGYNIGLRVSGYSWLAIYPATPNVKMYKQGGLVCFLTFSPSWHIPGTPL